MIKIDFWLWLSSFHMESSLAVQWLGLCTFIQIQSLVRELRSINYTVQAKKKKETLSWESCKQSSKNKSDATKNTQETCTVRTTGCWMCRVSGWLLFSCWLVSDSFATPWTADARFLSLWNFPGKNAGVGFAISSSRRSSQLRDGTHASSIGRRILSCWATREAPC